MKVYARNLKDSVISQLMNKGLCRSSTDMKLSRLTGTYRKKQKFHWRPASGLYIRSAINFSHCYVVTAFRMLTQTSRTSSPNVMTGFVVQTSMPTSRSSFGALTEVIDDYRG